MVWIQFLLGRQNNLIKSMVFLKSLYLFRTLPIDISSKYLNLWQKHFPSFLWNYMKSSIQWRTLYRPLLEGGQAITHFYAYCQVIRLTSITHILCNNISIQAPYKMPSETTPVTDLIAHKHPFFSILLNHGTDWGGGGTALWNFPIRNIPATSLIPTRIWLTGFGHLKKL